MGKIILKLVGVIFCLFAGVLRAQSGVEIDYTPFEKPKPFATFETENPKELFNELIDTVVSHKFKITYKDRDEFIFKASRTDPADGEAEDRILVWLDRDEEKPLERVHLFFHYGRFEKVWSSEGLELSRIRIPDSFEKEKVGDIKNVILNLSMR